MGTYLRDKFYRLKTRRGYKRAAVAIAHKILVSIYHMFSHQVSYNDLGDLYLDKLNKNHLTRNLVHRLERLGYSVTLTLQQIAAYRKIIFMAVERLSLLRRGSCQEAKNLRPTVSQRLS